MYAVAANEESRTETKIQFTVIVAKGDNEHSYDVALPLSYYKMISKGICNEKEFVEKAFRFLLEHESPDAILPTLEIPLIQTYFPNFEKTILSH